MTSDFDLTPSLLGQVLEPDNLQRALKQVRRNKGAPGIDGMTVDDLADYLKLKTSVEPVARVIRAPKIQGFFYFFG